MNLNHKIYNLNSNEFLSISLSKVELFILYAELVRPKSSYISSGKGQEKPKFTSEYRYLVIEKDFQLMYRCIDVLRLILSKLTNVAKEDIFSSKNQAKVVGPFYFHERLISIDSWLSYTSDVLFNNKSCEQYPGLLFLGLDPELDLLLNELCYFMIEKKIEVSNVVKLFICAYSSIPNGIYNIDLNLKPGFKLSIEEVSEIFVDRLCYIIFKRCNVYIVGLQIKLKKQGQRLHRSRVKNDLQKFIYNSFWLDIPVYLDSYVDKVRPL